MIHSKKIVIALLLLVAQVGFSRGQEFGCTLQSNGKVSHFSAFMDETTVYEFNGYSVTAELYTSCPSIELTRKDLNITTSAVVGNINEFLYVHLKVEKDEASCLPK